MEEIYKRIEEKIDGYKYPFQIADEFINLRDNGLKTEQERSQWEIDAFNFVISGGKLKEKFQSSDKDGEIIKYPTLERFTPDTYEYFNERLVASSHPLLGSVYATILWNSPVKHTRYALKAIEAFLLLTDYYHNKDLKDGDKKQHYGLYVMSSIENAFYIAKQFKSGLLLDIERKIVELITNYPEISTSAYALRLGLTRLAVEEKFKKSNLKKIKTTISKMGSSYYKNGDYVKALNCFEGVEHICKLLQENYGRWLNKQALCYERMSIARGQQPDMGHLHNCEQAILIYKRTKNTKKIDVLTKRYERLKSNQILNKISVPLDDELGKKVREQNDELSKKISRRKTAEIIGILTFSQFVLPNVQKSKEVADDISSKYVFTHLANTQVFDSRNNTPEKFFQDASKEKFNHIQQYLLTFELSYADLLHRVLYRTIAKNSMFMYEVLDYLNTESWYSKQLNRNVGSDVYKYKWIELIAPALNDYYIEYRKLVLGKIEPNFVLAVDSLTLIIEGIIRDLCRIQKIPTTHFKDDGTTIEADLPRLLQIKKLSEIIDEDDIFLLRVVLIPRIPRGSAAGSPLRKV
jgi:hypothetical protein